MIHKSGCRIYEKKEEGWNSFIWVEMIIETNVEAVEFVKVKEIWDIICNQNKKTF